MDIVNTRRNDTLQLTPAEHAIRAATAEVEMLPADQRLTDAVILLEAARNRVADFVDNVEGIRMLPTQYVAP